MTGATYGSATTLGSWLRALRRCLDANGFDGEAVMLEAGLSPHELDGPEARCPRSTTRRLWELAVETSGDPAFGLRVASYITPTSCHALSYSLVASPTLKEAFERIVRYCHVVSNAVEYEFSRQGDEYHLEIGPYLSNLPPVHESIDMLVAAFLRMCRSSLGRDYAPLRIELCRPTPTSVDGFQQILRAPVSFGCERNRIVFDRESMELPLENGNPDLARHNDAITQQMLARIERDNIPARVRAVLVKRLEFGEPSQEDVAEMLNVSSRTLQRKLGEGGTTFMELLDDTRRELAQAYLGADRYSVGEVAFMVGFASNSSFTRAFRRWTGCAPTEWRKQQPGCTDHAA